MKRMLFILVIIGGLGGWWLWKQQQLSFFTTTDLPSPTPTVLDGGWGLAQNEASLLALHMESGDFRLAWELIPSTDEVVVGINPDLVYSSRQLVEKYGCRILTSGAFYNSDNQPLGLLVNQGATLSAWRNNVLLHGVIGQNKDGVVILRDMSNQIWLWAVQAGPIVWQDGQSITLSLTTDQEARRVVAGITEQGQLVLMVIVGKDSLYGGPLLTNVAEVLNEWQQITGIVLKSALNLDGGTASAFISPTFALRELKPIGSYICVR